MGELSLEQINQLTVDTVTGKVSDIHSPEADAFLQELQPELLQMERQNIIVEVPDEWPQAKLDLRHDGYYGD